MILYEQQIVFRIRQGLRWFGKSLECGGFGIDYSDGYKIFYNDLCMLAIHYIFIDVLALKSQSFLHPHIYQLTLFPCPISPNECMLFDLILKILIIFYLDWKPPIFAHPLSRPISHLWHFSRTDQHNTPYHLTMHNIHFTARIFRNYWSIGSIGNQQACNTYITFPYIHSTTPIS